MRLVYKVNQFHRHPCKSWTLLARELSFIAKCSLRTILSKTLRTIHQQIYFIREKRPEPTTSNLLFWYTKIHFIVINRSPSPPICISRDSQTTQLLSLISFTTWPYLLTLKIVIPPDTDSHPISSLSRSTMAFAQFSRNILSKAMTKITRWVHHHPSISYISIKILFIFFPVHPCPVPQPWSPLKPPWVPVVVGVPSSTVPTCVTTSREPRRPSVSRPMAGKSVWPQKEDVVSLWGDFSRDVTFFPIRISKPINYN